jgi:sulfoacetaldehyde dehydrogenase
MADQEVIVEEYISELITRARKAQKAAERLTQHEVDELAAAIAWEFVSNEKLVEELAEFSFNECRMGDVQSKIIKTISKCRGVYFDVKNQKSVGIVEEIPEKGLIRIAKPVGVIGSLVPGTQGEMHPILQAINVVKARDAIIFSPHPKAKKTTAKICRILRDIMKRYNVPEDLFICIEDPSIEKTKELMKQCDLVMATGGHPMVLAAYSSGTPALGVGAGNAIIMIDKSADLEEAATKIKMSKTFDLAAGCSCDNSLVIDESVYDEMLAELKKVGAYLATPEEKIKIRKALWPNWPEDLVLNRDIVASPVENIARIAGITIPQGTCMILVEEDQTGAVTPFAGEKLCLVTTIYKCTDIDDAVRIINSNHEYSGAGHSCGIFSKDKAVIEELALRTYTTRVVVNQPQSYTNTGNWVSGMPFTSSLGCGTWGGNIASENIILKHYLNNTWVIHEIPKREPTDEELFAGFIPKT